MSSLEALKQTRVIQMEQITRERQKYRDLTDADPATFKVNRMKESLRKVRVKKDDWTIPMQKYQCILSTSMRVRGKNPTDLRRNC